MAEKKRNHFDSHINYGPPSKKPYNPQNPQGSDSGTNDEMTSSSLNAPQAIANIDISDPEWLERYQKEALIRALREYKRQAERALEMNEKLQSKEIEYQNRLIIIDQFLEYLRMFLCRFDEEDAMMDIGSDGSYLQHMSNIINMEDKTLENTKEVISKIVDKIITWLNERNLLIKTLQPEHSKESKCTDLLTSEVQKLSRLYINVLEKINEQDNRLSSLHDLTRELEVTKASLDSTTQQLEATQDKLSQLEKNVDRSNSFTLNPFLHTGKKVDTSAQSSNSANRAMDDRMELVEQRTLAESRLKECNESQYEKAEFKKKIYDLQEKLKYVPEERIKESEAYKALQVELEHLQQSYSHLYSLFEEKTREVQMLTASRDKADDLLKAEMKRMDQEFQDVKQEYLNDLDRIRAKRNELVKDVETLRSMIPQEFRQISAIRMLANDRMEFIHILKEEIRKLNIKIAAFEGNKNSIEHIRNVQLTPNELSFRESQGTDIAKYITESLSYEKVDRKYISEFCHFHESRILENLTNWIYYTLSRDDKLSRSTQNSPTMDSQQSLDIKELISRIKDLELMNDILKKNEQAQSREIELLFNQLEQRDDANHKKAFEICTQDQRVYTLKQSLTKFQQRLNAVTMENVSLQKERSSMAVVIQNQIDVIRQHKYLLTNLKSQLENHSNEASTTAQTLAIYKQKLQEFELEIKRYKTSTENLNNEVQKKSKEHTRELRRRDEEQRAMEKELRHVKEQLEVKKEQMEELRRNTASVPSETQRLLEAYETKWKCSSCNIRFKEHCLSSCMHAFCKVCLDKQVDGRNRKCAKCGQKFDKSDIKQIFF
ncbi:32156_t:CDS:10 [Gigaspora margarita]|uniref:E3 ubiquitin protein ligase n=1 Tax=Gigaspora margarita TaxID=4874 RepID=A0ABN7VJW3_GIGMA|nr:32156_t:CDS:10 [Gigaspora margarita]